MIAFKGATHYELQIGQFWLMVCHLKGQHWRWKPWRRVSFGYERAE